MISFTSVFQNCQAKLPEDSKSSLMYLTTSMICTRTQNLISNSRCIALEVQLNFGVQSKKVQLNFFFGWRKQTLISWRREGGSGSNKTHLTNVTHSFQSPKCTTIFEKPNILPVFSVSRRIFALQFHCCHYTKDQFEQAVNCRQRIYSKVITPHPP